jgi:hypothetical protein
MDATTAMFRSAPADHDRGLLCFVKNGIEVILRVGFRKSLHARFAPPILASNAVVLLKLPAFEASHGLSDGVE